MKEKKNSFWMITPAILTAIAALIKSITGLYVALNRSDDNSSSKPLELPNNAVKSMEDE
ncbi:MULTISPECIES: hypothetical protein [unclassified Saccharicrinis]|uniref:hypothetical protein n=1 Tax=unclassified Saccharicrinis TaxID=2646859 RepID=UPI003D33A830